MSILARRSGAEVCALDLLAPWLADYAAQTVADGRTPTFGPFPDLDAVFNYVFQNRNTFTFVPGDVDPERSAGERRPLGARVSFGVVPR